MIRFKHIAIGTGGGPRCRRCSAASAEQSFRDADGIATEMAAVVHAWGSQPGPNILFTGAEPFAHDALPTLITQAQAAGVGRVGLVTDGGALGFGDNAAGAIHTGVRHVVVRSIGIGGAADERAGRPGLSDAVLAGIKTFVAAAGAADVTVAISAEVAVCRHNARDLPSTVAAFAATGVGCVTFYQEAGATPAPASVSAMLAAACDTGVVNGVWVEVRDLPLPSTHERHRSGDEAAS